MLEGLLLELVEALSLLELEEFDDDERFDAARFCAAANSACLADSSFARLLASSARFWAASSARL